MRLDRDLDAHDPQEAKKTLNWRWGREIIRTLAAHGTDGDCARTCTSHCARTAYSLLRTVAGWCQNCVKNTVTKTVKNTVKNCVRVRARLLTLLFTPLFTVYFTLLFTIQVARFALLLAQRR